ncbi:signal peptidase I [Vagococcus salmoninarum]|uniref:Signal peptidase I n=1 Tax=Vagococcus salmoninarum TaxID=2739 RepID=A0A429ZSV1_9ENTE|nr:signal peptidase I [Vagococcus salmoninarum]MBE9388744.1 signal peptidase I [Vagococcus salmoninarum]RST96699.1 signal peptidase I [Vagococcus salmoninarum]
MTVEGQKKRKRKKRSRAASYQKKQKNLKLTPIDKHLKNLQLWLLSFSVLVVIVTVSILLTTSFGKMSGYSMLPLIEDGDVFTVNKDVQVKRFDIVYLTPPNKKTEKSIRRIIGMPGDELFYKNDELFINQEGKPERYLNDKKNQLVGGILTPDFSLASLSGQHKVPADSYFVMGDNRQSSADSRDYGFVGSNQIIGKVESKIFPFN